VLLRQTDVRHLVTGAVQPKLSMGKLKSLKLTLPSGRESRALEQLCEGQMALSRALADETQTLVRLRDTLLPQLMSGKLRGRDAEKQVEAVV
jgi:type I restriction enzyme, S subunit